MKGKKMLLGLLFVLIFTEAAMASRASMMYGEVIFDDPALSGSTNTLSCNSCHTNGREFDLSTDINGLATQINHCVTEAMQAPAINEQSIEMRSLQIYILGLIHY